MIDQYTLDSWYNDKFEDKDMREIEAEIDECDYAQIEREAREERNLEQRLEDRK